MHRGNLLFVELMEHIPPMEFERCVARYGSGARACALLSPGSALAFVCARVAGKSRYVHPYATLLRGAYRSLPSDVPP